MNDQTDIEMPDLTGFENTVRSMGMAKPAPGFTDRWKVYAAARQYEKDAVRRFAVKAAAVLGGLLALSIVLFFGLLGNPTVSSTYADFLSEFVSSTAAVGGALRNALQIFRAPAALIAGIVGACLIGFGGYWLIKGIAVKSLEKEGAVSDAEIH